MATKQLINDILVATVDNPGNRKTLAEGLRKGSGKIELNGRTYEVGFVNNKKIIRDVDVPNSVTSFRDLVPALIKKDVILSGGIPRPASTFEQLLEFNLKRMRQVPGLTESQVLVRAKTATEQAMMTQANRMARQLSKTATVAQNSSRKVNAARLEQVRQSVLAVPAVDAVDDLVKNRSAIQSSAAAIADSGVAPKTLPSAANNKIAQTIELVDQQVGMGKTTSKVKKRLAQVAGFTIVSIAAALAGKYASSQSAAGDRNSQASAATDASSQPTAAQLKEAERLLDSYLQTVFVQMALDHQNFLNGCFLYDTIDGTLTKVKLLSCGKVVIDNAMDTCAINDSSKGTCPENTFIPCLDEACTSIVYNGTEPDVPSNVSKQNACSNSDAPCSSFCQTNAFQLSEHLELLCIDVDLPTAYVDLMDVLGYNIEELFPSPSRKMQHMFGKVGIGILILLLLAVLCGLAWYWYQRHRQPPVRLTSIPGRKRRVTSRSV